MVPDQKSTEQKPSVPDDLWENCKGQCGYTPWCRDCLLQKGKLVEERLNREGRSDDNKE
jgi:hypothetical protein